MALQRGLSHMLGHTGHETSNFTDSGSVSSDSESDVCVTAARSPRGDDQSGDNQLRESQRTRQVSLSDARDSPATRPQPARGGGGGGVRRVSASLPSSSSTCVPENQPLHLQPNIFCVRRGSVRPRPLDREARDNRARAEHAISGSESQDYRDTSRTCCRGNGADSERGKHAEQAGSNGFCFSSSGGELVSRF